jgi:uncharacterized membrane protein
MQPAHQEDQDMKHAVITETTFDTSLKSIGKPSRGPIHKVLVSFSAAYFTGALVTDLAYWHVPDVLWERFSIWLITAGLIVAGLAAIAYVFDLADHRSIERPAWPRRFGYAIVVLLSLTNAFVHSRDGYTAVVPLGLTLSALVVIVMLLTAWVGMALSNRHRVGG